MRKSIPITIILTAALALPLTAIFIRDYPFSSLPPSGEEYLAIIFGGSAVDSEHLLPYGFNRIRRVMLVHDRAWEKNRELASDEWSYDRSRHLLVTKVKGLSAAGKRLPEEWPPYLTVEGVMGNPETYYLDGFEGEAEDLFLVFSDGSKAVSGRDFRYVPRAKALILARDAKPRILSCMYWDASRHLMVQQDLGRSAKLGELSSPWRSKDLDSRILSMEKSKFLNEFHSRHPDLEYYALQKSDGPVPEVVLRKPGPAPSPSATGPVLRQSRRLASNASWESIAVDLGFDAQAPDQVLDLFLDASGRTIVESERSGAAVRTLELAYEFNREERVDIDAVKYYPDDSTPEFLVSRKTLALEGVQVRKTVSWALAVAQNYSPPAYPHTYTEYTWKDGSTRWILWTHELRTIVYSDYEGFIAEFIRLRRQILKNRG